MSAAGGQDEERSQPGSSDSEPEAARGTRHAQHPRVDALAAVKTKRKKKKGKGKKEKCPVVRVCALCRAFRSATSVTYQAPTLLAAALLKNQLTVERQ